MIFKDEPEIIFASCSRRPSGNFLLAAQAGQVLILQTERQPEEPSWHVAFYRGRDAFKPGSPEASSDFASVHARYGTTTSALRLHQATQ